MKGSRITNLKELRFPADDGVRRVAFAFDRTRIAVLLVMGDKRRRTETRIYNDLITTAEARWQTWGE